MAASRPCCAAGTRHGPSRAARNARRRAPSASTTSSSSRPTTEAQARAAGYRDAIAAHAELDRRPAKHLYVITVSYVGPDERPALAADQALTADDAAAISERLSRFDAASVTGPWTRRYLELIRDNEAVRAPDLAAREGLDVPRFKRRVRQLKGLG